MPTEKTRRPTGPHLGDRRPLLTVAEVASDMGVSPRTVRRLIGAGELATIRVRGAVRIEPAEVEAFKRRNTVPAVASSASARPDKG